MNEPFWPRRSPNFLACRQAVRESSLCSADSGGKRNSIVIGLSGGPDSLALVAAAAAERIGARAIVVDHGLQPGSADVAARAAEQAEQLGVPAEVVRVEVASGNLEARAREARYDALFNAGGEVWVAHTADDQAETLILGALRGNPSGMAPRAGNLVRPFLKVRRAQTVGACEELGLAPWNDPMNEDASFRRVAVRTGILPELSRLIGGDAVVPLAKAADRIAQDQQLIAQLTDLTPTDECGVLVKDEGGVRRRRLAAWLNQQGIAVVGSQLEAVEALVVNWRGQGPVAVGEGRAVARVEGRLVVVPNPREVAR